MAGRVKDVIKAVVAAAASSGGIIAIASAVIPYRATLSCLLVSLLFFVLLTVVFVIALLDEKVSDKTLLVISALSILLTVIVALLLIALSGLNLSGEAVIWILSAVFLFSAAIGVFLSYPISVPFDLTAAVCAMVLVLLLAVLSYIVWYLFHHTEEVIPIAEPAATARAVEQPVITAVEEEVEIAVAIEAEPVAELEESVTEEAEAVLPVEVEIVSEETSIPPPAPAEEAETESEEPETEPAIPPLPLLHDPYVRVTESRVYVAPDYEDDDFWADFYIQGEDELELADGIYYMGLYINDAYAGTVTVLIENGQPAVEKSFLEDCLTGNATDELIDRLFYTSEMQYLPLTFLEENGVSTRFDSVEFAVYLYLSTDDMPIQILSVSSRSSIFSVRPVAGAMRIEPAVFYLNSRYSLSSSARVRDWDAFKNSFRYTLSVSNSLRFFDVYGSFNYYLSGSASSFDMRFGTYSFYTDFQKQMMRLRWGNVSTDLLSPSGTAIGLRFDTSASYAESSYRRKSHIEQYITIEEESDVQILNEGREIFRRTLQAGNYRLRDFTLYSGANTIKIIITPLDGSAVKEYDIELNYSSSLLAPGEFYYGAAIATGRRNVLSDSEKLSGAIRLPWTQGRALEYDFRNVSLSGYFNVGLTKSLTVNLAAAVENEVSAEKLWNPSSILAAELTHANPLGTTLYNLRLTTDYTRLPSWYLRAGQQFSTGIATLSSISVSGTYSGDFAKSNTLTGSLSFSGRLGGKVSWSLSGYVSGDVSDVSTLYWSASNSYSFSLGRNMWMSAGINTGARAGGDVTISGRISATLRFGGVYTGASYSTDNSAYMNISAGRGNHSFNARVNTQDVTSWESYNLSADYSYSGTYMSTGISFSTDSAFSSPSLSVNASTQTLFADGLFTISNSIPSNFLLIRQKGALRGNELSMGSAGTSTSDVLVPVLGTHLYSGASTTRDTYLSVFSTSDDGFASAYSYDIMLPAGYRKGYVLRLEAEETYSASGVVEINGTVWVNGSSPLYKLNDEGTFTLTEEYLFTDSEGRFIISGLISGTYSFDVPEGKNWHNITFTIEEGSDSTMVILLDGLTLTNSEPSDIYMDTYTYTLYTEVTVDDYWAMLFPSLEEEVV